MTFQKEINNVHKPQLVLTDVKIFGFFHTIILEENQRFFNFNNIMSQEF